MPTTAKGTPYVVSTDLVANYPTVSSDLADHIDDKLAYNAVTINAQTGSGANAYTFALADASEGKLVTASNAAAATYTVPPQSSVTWADGAVLRILNQGAGTVTVAAGAGVTINGTPLTLAQYKGAAIQRTASNTWTFIPFSGGVGNLTSSNTPTGTYTGYQYWTFTSSGTFTVTGAGGLCDVLVVGGGGGGTGGGGNGGGGGGGAHFYATQVYLPAGSITVTVGAGGTGYANQTGAPGGFSAVGEFRAIGGGGGGGPDPWGIAGGNGGSGGGGKGTNDGVGGFALISGQGNGGGQGRNAAAASGGGGGGGSAAGQLGQNGVGGAGGAGTANSITGSSVTRSGGGGGASNTYGAGGAGGGGSNTAGTANTGGGGSGANNGGSGVVIIRTAV